MASHDFHLAIGKLIQSDVITPKDFPKSTPPGILKDKACDPEDGQTIALYSKAAGAEIELCNVDMLIEVERKAKVIIEIEESDVTPVHIFGKFFVSAFCDQYGSKKNGFKTFDSSMLFVQVVELVEEKSKSLKRDQWDRISESIRSILTCPPYEKRWEYKMYYGLDAEFRGNGKKGFELVSKIRDFVRQ